MVQTPPNMLPGGNVSIPPVRIAPINTGLVEKTVERTLATKGRWPELLIPQASRVTEHRDCRIKEKGIKELDDGWPESVDEQGLLLLVWSCNFRNGI